MSQQVLHFDFIRLRTETTESQRLELEAAAGELASIDGVLGVGTINGDEASDFDLAFWFVLRDYAALEPFGTHPDYIRFLQGRAAPLLQRFTGADVRLDEDIDHASGATACLALVAPEETYDFEVREALSAWVDSTGASRWAIGVAVGDRPLYRGAAIAFGAVRCERPETESFQTTLICGAGRTLT